MTSTAANCWPAFPLLISPNKALGERVGNGCSSDDITPLLCTASAVSAAAALKKKAIKIGKKGKAAVSQWAALPSKHPPKKIRSFGPLPRAEEKRKQLPVSSLSNGLFIYSPSSSPTDRPTDRPRAAAGPTSRARVPQVQFRSASSFFASITINRCRGDASQQQQQQQPVPGQTGKRHS